jgi:O-antigen ligase
MSGFFMNPFFHRMRSFYSEQMIFSGFICLLAVTGGSSRADEPIQIVVRLLALAGLAFAVFFRPIPFDRALRPAAIALAAAGIAIAIQLIPLPPSVWEHLPGRELYVQQGRIAGVENIWRPLSLSPDRTWNALLSLLVPLSVVALAAKLNRRRRQATLSLLVGILAFTALVALFRLITGQSWFTFLHSTDAGGSGVFANRNHQALLFAMGIPLLATWVVEDRLSSINTRLRWTIGAAGAATLMILIPTTGSRAGLALGGLAVLMATTILWKPASRLLQQVRHRKMRRLILALGCVALAGMTSLALTLSRAEGVQRLMTMDVAGDTRTRLLPRVLEMTATYFPAGAGYGSFDPAFRRFEQLGDLKQTYFNQAHDDLLQIVIEGGGLGIALLTGALAWLLVQSIRVWRASATTTSIRMARLASFLLLLMIIASVVDYPLRTPFMMALFALFTIWLYEPAAMDNDSAAANSLA